MPSSVVGLFAAAGLEPAGCVAWGLPVSETRTGVYVISLTAAPDCVDGVRAHYPVSDQALDELLAACPTLTVDYASPTRDQIAKRIGSYWLADECVLYIGLAGQPLRTRVRQYYATPLGAPRPHKGGWWLKTLGVLDDLHVHYAATDSFKDAEEKMLRAFAARVSARTCGALPVGDPVMPFANLRDGDWQRKRHGIKGATGEPAMSGGAPPNAAAATDTRPKS